MAKVLFHALVILLIGSGIGVGHALFAPPNLEAPTLPPTDIGEFLGGSTGDETADPGADPGEAEAQGDDGADQGQAEENAGDTTDTTGADEPEVELPPGHVSLDQAEQLHTRALDQGDVVFIDTRNRDDFEEERIAGAVNIPINEFRDELPDLPMDYQFMPELENFDALYVIYCGGTGEECTDSKDIAYAMEILGYAKVVVLWDGFPGWVDAGLPTESGAP